MSSSIITQQSTGLATNTQPGLVGTGAQTFAGNKTFVDGINFGNEVLKNYDEGTWIPTLTFGGSTTGITYSANRYGHYTRIGNRCFYNCYFLLTSKGTAAGLCVITGLPFTSASLTNGGHSSVTIWSNGVSATNGQLMGYTSINSTQIELNYTPTNADATGAVALSNVHWSNTGSIMISGSYVIA